MNRYVPAGFGSLGLAISFLAVNRCGSVYLCVSVHGLFLFLGSNFMEELLSLPALTWLLTSRPAPFSRQPGAHTGATMALLPGPATLPHTLLLLPALLSPGTPLSSFGRAFLGSSLPLSPPCLHLRFGYPLQAPGTRAGFPKVQPVLVREPRCSVSWLAVPL